MSRWQRILRGMIGMGLTFAAGVGTIMTLIAAFAWLFLGAGDDMGILVVGSTVWAFAIGVAFSGALALVARDLSFEKLSLPKVAALGAGGGLLMFGVLALNAWSAWSPDTAIANAALFTFLGSGSATASLLIARKADSLISSRDEPDRLEDADLEGSFPTVRD